MAKEHLSKFAKMAVQYGTLVGQFLLILLLVCPALTDTVPLWKTLMTENREWLGFYRHDGGNYNCNLKVLSVGLSESQTGYVTFTSEHISLDMTVLSGDGDLVVFKESSTYSKHAHFEGHQNLVFVGQILPYHHYYHFEGNVSSEEMKDFGTVSLKPKGHFLPVTIKDNSSLRYGLAIGIPVILAICLTAAGATILWWAHKNGYLRHIPLAYKNFTNPKNTGKETTEGTSEHEMTEGEQYNIEQPGSVHI